MTAVGMSMGEYNQRLVAGQNDSAKHDALYDAHQRIAQLEALNATLAAQIDRMTLVVDAAGVVADGPFGHGYSSIEVLIAKVRTYEQQMTALAKGVG